MNKQAVYYCVENGLHLSGHTHRPDEFQLKAYGAKLLLWRMNPGYGAVRERMHYIKRQDSQAWGRGCIVGTCNANRQAFRSKQWDAELRIHSLHDERFVP